MSAPPLGRLGVWQIPKLGTPPVAELEALGYGALWLGSSPSVQDAGELLAASSTITVATGILNVWQHEPAEVAAAHAAVQAESGGRFLLGIGIGHPEATSEYRKPLTTMREWFDALDAAAEPVPREERIAAALGPKMLDLAGERSLGAHPYFTPAEHTRLARERLGPDAVLAPEVAVVLEEDETTARAIAREYAERYLARTNYAASLLRLGYTEEDVAGGGSDRLVDDVIPQGSPERVAAAVEAHFEAGADHVCVQPLGHGPAPLEDYRALAKVLL